MNPRNTLLKAKLARKRALVLFNERTNHLRIHILNRHINRLAEDMSGEIGVRLRSNKITLVTTKTTLRITTPRMIIINRDGLIRKQTNPQQKTKQIGIQELPCILTKPIINMRAHKLLNLKEGLQLTQHRLTRRRPNSIQLHTLNINVQQLG